MAEPDDPRQRLTSEEAARFSQEIAAITSAGLPLAPGLRATAEEMPPGRLRSALNAVASGIGQEHLLMWSLPIRPTGSRPTSEDWCSSANALASSARF
ncbi:MAG: hypothetical protein U0794_07735 [Isosphaeraceae bacterium]